VGTFSRLAGTAATLLVLGISAAARSAGDEPPPVADFFRNAAFYDLQISRDGRYLSAITRTDHLPTARNIVVMEVGRWNESRLVTAYEDEEVRWHDWADEERLVFKVDRAYEDPNRTSEYVGFYSVRHDGDDGRVLHEPFRRDTRRGRGTSAANMASGAGGIRENLVLISDLPRVPDHVMVAMAEGTRMFPDAFRLDLENGRLQPAGQADGRISRWFADHQGRVRVAVDRGEERDDLEYDLVYRAAEDADWRTLLSFAGDDVQPHGFDGDDRHFWLSARVDGDRAALFRLDPDTGELGEPVLTDPVHDVAVYDRRMRGLVSDRDGRALAFEYMAEKPEQASLDDAWDTRQQMVDELLPDTINQILDWSDDGQRLVIRSWSDRRPGEYHLLDLDAGELRFIVAERPWLKDVSMSEMRPVSFEARDGLTIHGYLTLPHEHSVGGCAPTCASALIVHPHGGPYGIRDGWGFNEDVQFLASRGYAVLQVNYRGSGGYGRRFEAAGYKRWGLEMQDDLTDAVAWAVARGIADPARIVIYGASYGGYAAMMGLVKTPGLYRAGINYVGVVDLVELHRQDTRKDRNSIAGYDDWLANWWLEHIGHPRADHDRFFETSPLNFVERIESPVLVIHGRLDQRVADDYQYKPLVRALKKHGKEHETFYKRHEGHGFYREQNQIELYEQIEKFLARHVPAGPPEAEALSAEP
jgi:dipeptidyl aminopeptidase/acylaminoacyl peptidase